MVTNSLTQYVSDFFLHCDWVSLLLRQHGTKCFRESSTYQYVTDLYVRTNGNEARIEAKWVYDC